MFVEAHYKANAFLEENKTVYAVLILLALLSAFPVLALADTGVSSGLDAILRSNTLEGEDTFRATIAGYLHRPISFIITVAGFMMIMFTFMKMALTLWYLSFPDFFDRIDAQQRAMLGGGLKGRKSPTDVITYFLGLIFPNVKLLTDYAGDNNSLEKEPLAYLKSQLPKIFLMIVLGAAIYDGQVRNIIAKAGDIALMFGNLINNHDTVGMVADFIGVSEKYLMTYDTSTQEGKNEEKIAKAIQNHLHSLNPNIKSSEHGVAVGLISEEWTKKVKAAIQAAMGEGGMGGDISTITSFKISVIGKTVATPGLSGTEGTGTDAVAKGYKSGKIQFELTDTGVAGATAGKSFKISGSDTPADDAALAKLVLDNSKQKYVIVQFSELRDKSNRNWLWSNDVKNSNDNTLENTGG